MSRNQDTLHVVVYGATHDNVFKAAFSDSTDTWRNDNVFITSPTSFWRNEDVIIASCAHWDVFKYLKTSWVQYIRTWLSHARNALRIYSKIIRHLGHQETTSIKPPNNQFKTPKRVNVRMKASWAPNEYVTKTFIKCAQHQRPKQSVVQSPWRCRTYTLKPVYDVS